MTRSPLSPAPRREIVSRGEIMVCNGRQQRRYSEAEALAYVAKGYHQMWRMESVGCHYTNMSYPSACISTYRGPEGSGYTAVLNREPIGVAPSFPAAVALVRAALATAAP